MVYRRLGTRGGRVELQCYSVQRISEPGHNDLIRFIISDEEMMNHSESPH